MMIDLRYDLRHNARFLVEGNWTVNEKEDIYSGVVQMDTVRIRFSLRGIVWTFLLCM
jgi:hypothetical protein